MSYSTYFEIGGHIIENDVRENRDVLHNVRPSRTDVKYWSKQTGVPAPLLRKAGHEVQKKTGYDIIRASQAHGRFRRARWAAGVATTLVLADGPLPIGDALAAGFLGAYAIYEVVHGVQDIRQ